MHTHKLNINLKSENRAHSLLATALVLHAKARLKEEGHRGGERLSGSPKQLVVLRSLGGYYLFSLLQKLKIPITEGEVFLTSFEISHNLVLPWTHAT